MKTYYTKESSILIRLKKSFLVPLNGISGNSKFSNCPIWTRLQIRVSVSYKHFVRISTKIVGPFPSFPLFLSSSHFSICPHPSSPVPCSVPARMTPNGRFGSDLPSGSVPRLPRPFACNTPRAMATDRGGRWTRRKCTRCCASAETSDPRGGGSKICEKITKWNEKNKNVLHWRDFSVPVSLIGSHSPFLKIKRPLKEPLHFPEFY